MKKFYVKSLKEYNAPSKLNAKKNPEGHETL